jgi:hypothetical protein
MGEGDFPEVYAAVAEQLKQADPDAGAAKLLEMAQDETYYDYWDERFPDEDDARTWTTLHAIRTLEHMGEYAHIAIEPLLPFLNEEGDYIREEMPTFYGIMGRVAIEPLTRMLKDTTQEDFLRGNAADSLSEIAQKHPDTRDEIVALLEKALTEEREDPFVAGEARLRLAGCGRERVAAYNTAGV